MSLGDQRLTTLIGEELRIRSRDLAFERAVARRQRNRMSTSQFGIIGLGTMGRNLALNVESRGFRVAVWNLETPWIVGLPERDHPGAAFDGTPTFEAFTAALVRPRRIMMMIPAGKPVDATIEKLLPLLDRGDVVIDGGNSWFEDTRAP